MRNYIGGGSMGIILGWGAFVLAALRLVSIVVHAIYSATAKGDTLADSGNLAHKRQLLRLHMYMGAYFVIKY